MFHIKKSAEGWTVNDSNTGYSRSLSAPEIEKLRTEFPQLAEVTTFSTDRIRSIRVRLLTEEEFDSFLKKTFGDRYKGTSTQQAANGKYEVSFFNYTEEQKAEMKRRREEGETSP